MDDRITLYREWLPLEKKQFRILAMLADKGESVSYTHLTLPTNVNV